MPGLFAGFAKISKKGETTERKCRNMDTRQGQLE